MDAHLYIYIKGINIYIYVGRFPSMFDTELSHQVTCLHLEKVVTVPGDKPSHVDGSVGTALSVGFLQEAMVNVGDEAHILLGRL